MSKKHRNEKNAENRQQHNINKFFLKPFELIKSKKC